MNQTHASKPVQLGQGILKMHIYRTGNLKAITDDSNNIRINTYLGNNFEKTISNLYLLVKDGNEYEYTHLLGVGSPSKVSFSDNTIIYQGVFKGIQYEVIIKVFDDLFICDVQLGNHPHLQAKLFYGLDVSIGEKWGIDANEAYISQYIDHKVFEDQLGFTICSRQNQGRHYYFELGSLTKNVGYSTDGFQFFGKDYKFDYVPRAIKNQHLDNQNYQYEFSYSALETDWLALNKKQQVIFYGGFLKDHNEAIQKMIFKEKAQSLVSNFLNIVPTDEAYVEQNEISFDNIYPYYALTKEELSFFYSEKHEYLEFKDGKELSFFLPNKAHVVLPYKEKYLERPSGNILFNLHHQDGLLDIEKTYATTTYLFGLFNSQIVYGNTSFNKLLTNQRNPLNLQKITGQRIFIKRAGIYQLLAMPAVYEMGLNYAKWIYKVDDDYLIIENIMSQDEAKNTLLVSSLKKREYDFLVTNHLVMKQTEDDEPVMWNQEGQVISFSFSEGSMTANKYPEYSFALKSRFDQAWMMSNNLLALEYHTASFDITIAGCEKQADLTPVLSKEKDLYLEAFTKLLNNFQITTSDQYIASYNYLAYWLVHDALVHYTTPHGLEQYNGAAWGTRDVSQGSFELFKAFHQYDEMKRIIKTVFAHQFQDTNTFPQWFMFDRFTNICDTSSHGDVILWPLRMVGMYLKETGDLAFLQTKIPYLDKTIMDFSGEDSLFVHIKNAISSIEKAFIPGTYLSCYGGGDWDDTLQPAKSEYKKKMTSGWTPQLTYEVLILLSEVLEEVDSSYSKHLKDLCKRIKIDYHKYVMIDGVPAGFLLFDENQIIPIIHPQDQHTKIKYRLLPLLRGCMSGIFNEEEITKAQQLIDEYMVHPDGVRLMNQPIFYHGGVNTFFQRAETASNFGREIGMQYCHAHIRYCEMLQKQGLKEKFYHEFLKINPIIIKSIVPNAMERQCNSYFSSSDAAFLNRYEVQKHFDWIKKGQVGVKGGWRVYSSGSGIYLYNLITGYFGIEIINRRLTIRPNVINDDLKLTFKVFDKMLTFIYHVGPEKMMINSQECHYKIDNHRFIILDELHDGDIIDIYS